MYNDTTENINICQENLHKIFLNIINFIIHQIKTYPVQFKFKFTLTVAIIIQSKYLI